MRRDRVLLAVRRTLEHPSLAGKCIVSALSGGADSVALLHALVAVGRERGIRVIAAHLDHQLRVDSERDAAFCGDLCARLGVPLRAGRADVAGRAARDHDGIEQAARLERRAFLRRVQAETGAIAIAIAHTRDDQAETVLLRLLRGSGRVGLGAMRARTRHVVRPLLEVSRAEVLSHLEAHGLTWREDPTNQDLRFARNRVRHELIPYLETHFNPRVRRTLARSAGLLSDEASTLGREGNSLYLQARMGGDAEPSLARGILRNAPAAIARLALRRALESEGGLAGVSATHIERLLRLAQDPASSGRRLPLPGSREALVRFDRIVIAPRRPAAEPFVTALPVPGRVLLPDGRIVAADVSAGPGATAPDQAVVPAPSTSLSVRTRQPGDRIRFQGREVSLKRYLLDRRVPADLRTDLPLVAEGSRVVWIPGLVSDVQEECGRAFVRLRLERAETRA